MSELERWLVLLAEWDPWNWKYVEFAITGQAITKEDRIQHTIFRGVIKELIIRFQWVINREVKITKNSFCSSDIILVQVINTKLCIHYLK